MPQLVTAPGLLRNKQRTALWYARERTRSLRNPTERMGRTHSFAIDAATIDTANVLPVASRSRSVTFAVDVKRTGASQQGIIMEIGDATTGIAIWVPDGTNDIKVAAGDSAADDGVTLTASDVLVKLNGQIRIVFSVNAQSGEARLWVNGALKDSATATNGALPNGWSSSASGAVAQVNGAVTTRVDVADRISLVDVAVVSLPSIYVGQLPRHFDDKHELITPTAFSPINAFPASVLVKQDAQKALAGFSVTDPNSNISCVTITVRHGILSF